ncbi:Replication-associated recombination protein RarA [hydrothermal vent metagenome]|uniref:Replication-associated recombination protein RarA n=1 Tax=hydrothermal vent metagenome TaxID=652676 RepID=A0A3B1E5H2_9ZZZZ
MSDLWAGRREAARRTAEPLAVRMRPRTLAELVGQEHILGEGKLLRRMLDAETITSLILHGPPGTGKTTLAGLIAHHTRRHFEHENAAGVGVKRIREIVEEATRRLELEGKRTILFLDEIHRFTRAQQDVLLADVERGIITLIGATTENPLFYCNSALVSRSTLFRLEPLSEAEIITVLRRAIEDKERGYGSLDVRATDEALEVWAIKSDGDARRALNALEVAVLSSHDHPRPPTDRAPRASEGLADATDPATAPTPRVREGLNRGAAPLIIDRATAEDSIQQKAAVYDGTGDEHYDAISAMIKSVRGSDPDAAVYWIARMLEAGEDPRFIARRLAILASEDIGNADPRGIMVAEAAWSLAERVGMPEARITLAQCATYLALAPKSNAAYMAIEAALKDVREGRTVAVPLHLRDANSSPIGEGVKMRDRQGEKYAYSHTSEHRVDGLPVTGQDYLGVKVRYYQPIDAGAERAMGERLEKVRRLRAKLTGETPAPLEDG